MRPPPTAFSISERELDEKLELLQQLSLEDEAQRWFQDESDWPQEDPSDYVPYGHGKVFSFTLHLLKVLIPWFSEEYNADACEACVYDPYLFSPSNPRTYPVGFPNRDKVGYPIHFSSPSFSSTSSSSPQTPRTGPSWPGQQLCPMSFPRVFLLICRTSVRRTRIRYFRFHSSSTCPVLG